jgi:GxxExxY protein
VSRYGLWLLIHEDEVFLPFEKFPWFQDAPIGKVVHVELPSEQHLYWPELDVDLEVESVLHPERYPLVSRVHEAEEGYGPKILPQRTQRGAEENINEVTGQIIDAAMKVHSALGPGLLEGAYEACLRHELTRRGYEVKSQVLLPVEYDGTLIDAGYRLDLLVNDSVIIELKAVEKLAAIHEGQLLTYLKLGKKRVGLLLNFNVVQMKDGIKRLVNNL